MKVIINGVLYPKRIDGRNSGYYHRAGWVYRPNSVPEDRLVISNDNFIDNI